MAETVRIVIGEDDVLMREGIARLLTEAGFEVVAQAGHPVGETTACARRWSCARSGRTSASSCSRSTTRRATPST
jgi:hypothetical protein